MSIRTFESTNVTRLFAARHRHDFFGGKPRTGNAYQLAEPACRPLHARFCLLEYDGPVGGAPEGDLAAGAYAQLFEDRLRDRYLTLVRDLGRHSGLQNN